METAARSPKAPWLAAVRFLLQYCLFLVVFASEQPLGFIGARPYAYRGGTFLEKEPLPKGTNANKQTPYRSGEYGMVRGALIYCNIFNSTALSRLQLLQLGDNSQFFVHGSFPGKAINVSLHTSFSAQI